MLLTDVRKAVEAALENLTPARAQELAKGFLEPGAAKEQVAKTAGELLDWSARSREKLREFVAHEVAKQMKSVGVATQTELDALKKKVRDLERASGSGASSKKTAAPKSGAKKTTARKPAAKRSAAKPTA
jgi:polyhydroxyalkanoate synthesis regulator phasin